MSLHSRSGEMSVGECCGMMGWRFTVLEQCDALKGDAEFVWIEETRGVIEKLNVLLSGQLVFSRLVC